MKSIFPTACISTKQSTSSWQQLSVLYVRKSYAHSSYVAKMGITLTHWGRVTHICVGNLTIIGSDTGLSPGRRQAIIWTNAGLLLIGPLGINFREILVGIHKFSFTKMHLKMSSAKWRPFSLGLHVLTHFFLTNSGRFTDDNTKSNYLTEIWLISIFHSLMSILGVWLLRNNCWFI